MPEFRNIADAVYFLSTQAETIIHEVVERQCAGSSGQSWSMNPAARQRCLEDNRFHLHYLTTSISAGDPAIFADYCGWVKIVLQKRGIAVSHFEDNLKYLREWMLASAPENIADVIEGYLALALRHLPEYPDEPAPVTLDKNINPIVAKYIERVVALDSEGAARLIESSATDAASVADLFLNVLQPAQREIGRLWQINAISVGVEHYATTTMLRILRRLADVVPLRTSNGARFVGICPEGEQHCAGLEMVCSLFRLHGWESHFVGANTSTASALEVATRLQPDVIGVSVTTLMSLRSACALISKLKEVIPGATVLAGGYAASLGVDLWKALGADAFAADGASAITVGDRILAERTPSLTPPRKAGGTKTPSPLEKR